MNIGYTRSCNQLHQMRAPEPVTVHWIESKSCPACSLCPLPPPSSASFPHRAVPNGSLRSVRECSHCVRKVAEPSTPRSIASRVWSTSRRAAGRSRRLRWTGFSCGRAELRRKGAEPQSVLNRNRPRKVRCQTRIRSPFLCLGPLDHRTFRLDPPRRPEWVSCCATKAPLALRSLALPSATPCLQSTAWKPSRAIATSRTTSSRAAEERWPAAAGTEEGVKNGIAGSGGKGVEQKDETGRHTGRWRFGCLSRSVCSSFQ